jgi:asparagine synthase (glutamine-hydrolysing)
MRGVLPQQIIDKTKHGFGLPFGIWLRTDPVLAEIAESSVHSLKRHGWFRAEFLERVLAMHRAGHASYYGELVWILMTLGLWLESRTNSAAA